MGQDHARTTSDEFLICMKENKLLYRPSACSGRRKMPRLLYLPVEILQQVIEHANHSDVESLTLACKHLYDVGKSRLIAHRKLKERYGKITCGDPMKHWNDAGWGEHPARLLDMILDEPKIADYITRLELRDCSHLHNDPNIFLTPNGQIQAHAYASGAERSLDEQIESVAAHVKNYLGRQLAVAMWNDFKNRVPTLRKGSVLALLLIVLPNLNTISFSGGSQRSIIDPPWMTMSSDIATLFAQEVKIKHPLGCLKVLEVHDAIYDPHFLASMMGLPSLQTIRCQKTHLRYPLEDILPPTSSVCTLQMKQSSFPLAAVLSRISNLRDFECSQRPWTWHLGMVSQLPTPRHLAQTLLHHAGHSLTSLTLTGVSAPCKTGEEHLTHTWIGSLRDFKVLKWIRLDLEVLIDISATMDLDNEIVEVHVVGDWDDKVVAMNIEDGFCPLSRFDWERKLPTMYLDIAHHIPVVHRLINILPASAETLAIEMQANKHIMQQLLCRLPERKAERLPNLKEVLYECEERCVIGMEEACLEVGVRVAQVLRFGNFSSPHSDSMSDSDFSGFEDGDEPMWVWNDFEDFDGHYWNDYLDYGHDDHYEDCHSLDFHIESEAEHLSRRKMNEGYIENAEQTDEELANVYKAIADFEWLVNQVDLMMGYEPDFGTDGVSGIAKLCRPHHSSRSDLEYQMDSIESSYERMSMAQRSP